MKKLFFAIISISYFIISINYSNAVSYKDIILVNQNPKIENSENNIKWSKLLKNYVDKFIKEVNSIKEKYKIRNYNEINIYLSELWKMSYSLEIIQTKYIEKQVAEEVMKSVVDRMKFLNTEIKKILKNKISEIEKELEKNKNKYFNISNKLSKELNKLIFKILSEINKKENFNDRDREIIKVLKEIKEQSDILKNIEKKEYYNKEEIKEELVSILKTVKTKIISLKKLIWNS